MGAVIYFMLGSIWAIILMAGAIAAYLWVNGKLRERDSDATPATKTPPVPTRAETPAVKSGIVKAITPQEIKDEREKGFIDKMQDIIS